VFGLWAPLLSRKYWRVGIEVGRRGKRRKKGKEEGIGVGRRKEEGREKGIRTTKHTLGKPKVVGEGVSR